MIQKAIVGSLAVIVWLWCSSAAQAHIFWLLVDQDSPKIKAPVQVEIGFGHKFPKDEEIKAERLGSLTALGPDGQGVPLKQLSTTRYEFVPPAAGIYLINAQLAPGFVTRTPQGMKMQTKKGVPDANLCFRFDMAAKTLVSAGEAPTGWERKAGSSLEIMPLAAPQALKAGGELPVRVLFQGKPAPGVELKVTHDKWTDADNPFSLKTKTDAQGEFRLKLDQSGKWLVVATHKTPYHDLEECDENLYSASLTVTVR